MTILEVYHQKKLFCQKQPVSLNWKKIEGRDNQKIQKKLLSLKRRRNEHWKRRKMRGKEEKTNTEKEEETNFWKRRNERWKDDWRNGHSFWWKSFVTFWTFGSWNCFKRSFWFRSKALQHKKSCNIQWKINWSFQLIDYEHCSCISRVVCMFCNY